MLILKLLVVPAFLLLVSLAGKRWGPAVAGWLAGLPIITGPILLFLALERGAQFASPAAAASLSAVFASVSFSLVYAHLCRRFHWAPCTLGALAAWFAGALIITQLPASAFASLGLALATLVLAPRLFPPVEAQALRAVTALELALRMLAGAALTLFVTAAAAAIGPAWSGLLAVFPILGIVLAVFSHRNQGPAYVVSLLRAMALGLYSFATFCFTLSLALGPLGIAPAFGAALAATLVVQYATKGWLPASPGHVKMPP